MTCRIAQLNVASGALSQDRVGCVEVGETLVLALADGAGGSGGGARAADLAVELALGAAGPIDPRDGPAWCEVLTEIDEALDADPEAGEATLVVAAVWDGGIAGASVGDSGALLVNGSLRELTEDQHRRPLLGTGMARPVSFHTSPAAGTLILASDGLLHYAPPEAIRRLLQDPDVDRAALALLESVRLPSGALWDDTSLLLLRIDG